MTATAARASIDALDVAGRRVLVRVDFNVPLDAEGRITDDRRIRMALPTIRSIIDRGGRAILMSHLGRPAGTGPEPGLSLAPVAERLATLLAESSDAAPTVRFVGGSCVGPEAAAAAEALEPGEVLVLENLRFEAGEKSGDPAFAARLATMADAYCNDAFGTAHRRDASMVAVPEAMAGRPRVAGRLLRKELDYLQQAIDTGDSPFVAVLGGAKVSDKFAAIRNLARRVDAILVGGAMSYTLMQARGVAVGSSRVEPEVLEEAAAVLAEAEAHGTAVHLPEDHVCAERFAGDAPTRTVAGAIPDGWMGLDIGPATAGRYADILRSARTVVWNGPMGVFEMPPFDAGTRAVAEALVAATEAGAVTIVGGGDSAAAIEGMGLANRVSHVSTGGGASLKMLEGESFASVAVLDPA
ncbi:MAG: phosphoglycerate kinase [Planctomycetota bacterium]|jgi:phosphoglycerate kinase